MCWSLLDPSAFIRPSRGRHKTRAVNPGALLEIRGVEVADQAIVVTEVRYMRYA